MERGEGEWGGKSSGVGRWSGNKNNGGLSKGVRGGDSLVERRRKVRKGGVAEDGEGCAWHADVTPQRDPGTTTSDRTSTRPTRYLAAFLKCSGEAGYRRWPTYDRLRWGGGPK